MTDNFLANLEHIHLLWYGTTRDKYHSPLRRKFIANVYQGNLAYIIKNHQPFRYDNDFISYCFLVACSTNSSFDSIKYFVNELGVDVNVVNIDDMNCFMHARAYNPNLDIIKHLNNVIKIDKNARTRYLIDNYFTLTCARNSNLNVVKYIINELKSNIHHVNFIGRNGLLAACAHNQNLDIIKYLMYELKFDHNSTDTPGNTCFMLACTHNSNVDIVDYLHRINMNKNYTTRSGCTGFEGACLHNPNLDVVRFLCEQTTLSQNLKGISLTKIDKFKKIIMNQADTNNYTRFMDLIGQGIKIYSKNELNDIFDNLNPFMLSRPIIKNFDRIDPFTLKFNKALKLFDKLSNNVKKFYANSKIILK